MAPIDAKVQHDQPHRLTLLIHSLAGGGAERVLASLANHWAGQGREVTLITLDTVEHDRYPLDPRVRRVGLNRLRESRNAIQAVRNNWSLIRQLRRAVVASKPDRIVSFIETMNVTALLACRGLAGGVIIAERTDPRHHPVGRLWSWLRRLTYPFCRALVVQTERVRDAMRPIVRGRPIYVIPNAAPCCEPLSASVVSQTPVHRPRIVAAGRLATVKGFDLLLQAFARVAPQHSEWTLEILGDGPQRAELEQLIQDLQLSDRVRLHGWANDVLADFRNADLFVLSSRYEGFPNVLLEAMACGLPVISFDCDSGPAEIVRDGLDGLLVRPGDVSALAAAMDRLLSDAKLRQQLATRAAEVRDRFSCERIFSVWDCVLADSFVEENTRADSGNEDPDPS